MKEIKITKGLVTQVDDEDYERLVKHSWCASIQTSGRRKPYLRVNGRAWVGGVLKVVSIPRIILGITDPKIIIDHIDGNTLNNQKSNLRTCTAAQNAQNRTVAPRGKRYRGVHIQRGSVIAQITANRKTYYLGTFNSEHEAARAYNEAALRLHGEFACLNEIQS